MSDERGEIKEIQRKAHLLAIHNGKHGLSLVMVEHLRFQQLCRRHHLVFHLLIFGNAPDKLQQQPDILPFRLADIETIIHT